jgi:CelD/BcsL family acetyltransferase involved in cellulose biosynthesis
MTLLPVDVAGPAARAAHSVRRAHEIRPLDDPRWAELARWHPRASVFHTIPWLQALQRTYGYEPIAYTTSSPGAPLEDGMVFCRIASWATGRRLVSLPFSDHCEPLLAAPGEEHLFLAGLEESLRQDHLRYIEIRTTRPFEVPAGLFRSNYVYALHQINLDSDLATLFHRFHKSSTQRKIQRAHREGLEYQEGRSDFLLNVFWHLLVLTRRRHQIPPQPVTWFRNLIDGFGGALKIRVAFQAKRPVAAILTLRHRDTLVFKYGCSDARFNHLGGTHLLFWRSILEAKGAGLRVFDLGRSDPDNPGLITFKDRWGGARSTLNYWRFAVSSVTGAAAVVGRNCLLPAARYLFRHVPDRMLCFAGEALYRHIG